MNPSSVWMDGLILIVMYYNSRKPNQARKPTTKTPRNNRFQPPHNIRHSKPINHHSSFPHQQQGTENDQSVNLSIKQIRIANGGLHGNIKLDEIMQKRRRKKPANQDIRTFLHILSGIVCLYMLAVWSPEDEEELLPKVPMGRFEGKWPKPLSLTSPSIYFIHVGKAGGMTLREYLPFLWPRTRKN